MSYIENVVTNGKRFFFLSLFYEQFVLVFSSGYLSPSTQSILYIIYPSALHLNSGPGVQSGTGGQHNPVIGLVSDPYFGVSPRSKMTDMITQGTQLFFIRSKLKKPRKKCEQHLASWNKHSACHSTNEKYCRWWCHYVEWHNMQNLPLLMARVRL